MSAKRVLFLVGDFVEDYEVMSPWQILQMVGHEVYAVAPNKKAGEMVATAIHDFEEHHTYTEKRGHNFPLNATFAEIDAADFDALVIPGGRAPEYLRMDPNVLDLVRHFAQAGKPIAATCHAAQVLASAGVLEGRSCSAYPAVRYDVESAGGTFIEAAPGFDNVHVDGNLVSAPAWPANGHWMREFLKLLGSKIEP